MSARRDSDVEPAESGARPTVVDIVAPVAVDTAYSYRVPAGLSLKAGDLVDVPLGTRETLGVVWAVRETQAGANLKVVLARRDAPGLRAPLMRFIDWVARWTLSPRGMVLRMAIRAGAVAEAKGFAMGVRIEHPQAWVDSLQYRGQRDEANLPPAFYEIAVEANGRSVFSFCMCPGG